MQIEQMDREHQFIWERYDPEKVKEALAKSAGAFQDINTKVLLREIHQGRKQNSRGRPTS